MTQPDDLAVRSVALVVDGLVHDLNNPLTILLANLEMVGRRLRAGQPLDDDDRDALDECREASSRIAALLQDARRLSRAGATCHVDDVVAAALRSTKQVARDGRVRLGAPGPSGLQIALDEPRAAWAATTLLDAVLRRAPPPPADDDGGALTRPGDVAAVTVVVRPDGADDVVVGFVVGGGIDLGGLDPAIVAALAAGVVVVDTDVAAGVVALRLPRAGPAGGPGSGP
jgi:signal transduction histidine kinase